MKLDDAIRFQDGVNAEFCGKVLLMASRHFKTNEPMSVPQMEAARRAVALIEAVVRGSIEITH